MNGKMKYNQNVFVRCHNYFVHVEWLVHDPDEMLKFQGQGFNITRGTQETTGMGANGRPKLPTKYEVNGIWPNWNGFPTYGKYFAVVRG